jgi:uncharacterized protein YegL
VTETAYTEPDTGYQAKGLPAYLVLDTSSSMKPFEQLLNTTLLDIYDVLYGTPQISEFIHLSVISFNTTAVVVTPMTDIEELENLPTVTCNGATNLSPMFQLLRTRITEDVQALTASGTKVLRPVAFVLTDGEPTDKPEDSWQADLDRLRDPGWKLRPQLITYGFGYAREKVLKRIATIGCYLAEDGIQMNAEAVSAALTSLLNSLVASANARQLQVPESVMGYRSIPMDYVG